MTASKTTVSNERVSTLSTPRRVIASAAIVVVTALAFSAPAQASSFGFSWQFGNGGSNFQIHGTPNNGGYRRACVTNRQIKRSLRQQGYRHIEFLRDGRNGTAVFKARYQGHRYTIRTDRCTGRIRSVRLRGQGQQGGGHNGGGNNNWGNNWGNGPFGGNRNFSFRF